MSPVGAGLLLAAVLAVAGTAYAVRAWRRSWRHAGRLVDRLAYLPPDDEPGTDPPE